MTRDEIAAIDAHCATTGVAKVAYLKSLGLRHRYYDSRKRLKKIAAIAPLQPLQGEFIPISTTASEPKRESQPLHIEMRLPSGVEISTHGDVETLRSILQIVTDIHNV